MPDHILGRQTQQKMKKSGIVTPTNPPGASTVAYHYFCVKLKNELPSK
jgi:hypothetical protein